MAKPIFLVQVNDGTPHVAVESITKQLSERLPDYHVLCAITGVEELTFSAFYDKDLIDTDFDKFKQMVLEMITDGQESKV